LKPKQAPEADAAASAAEEPEADAEV
jgi:hypothetical protein